MQEKLFIPVDNLNFNDLYDWSKQEEFCKASITIVRVPCTNDNVKPSSTRIRVSQTGSLVNCNEHKIALFRYARKVYAVDEKCPHLGGPLHLGDIEEMPSGGLCIRCPWHSWRFDLETGQLQRPKRDGVSLTVYPVQLSEDGKIYVGFDQFSPNYFKGDIEF